MGSEAGGRPPLIDWFSPLLPARTDIAHFSARLLPELSKVAEVRLWTPTEWDPAQTAGAKVRRFDATTARTERPGLSPDLRLLSQADAVVYNMGNHAGFHGAIWAASQRKPGVMIIHELCFRHMFANLMGRDKPNGRYLDFVEGVMGAKTRKLCADQLAYGAMSFDELAARVPLIEAVVAGARGVVCHNPDVAEAVRKVSDAPTTVLELPYPVAEEAPAPAREPGRPPRFLQFGHIGGPSRRLEEVLRALASHRDRPFSFRILGEIWDRKGVEALIDQLGLRRRVTIGGFVADADLDRALQEADLVFNLRYPSMGEASGSQLRIWANGAPSVVTRTGWYRFLPDDVVVKVDPSRERAELSDCIAAVMKNPDAFRAVGQAGRRRLQAEHTPARYARDLVRFIADLQERELGASLSGMAEASAARASAWTGLDTAYPVGAAVSRVTASWLAAPS
jgi:glycosyltransferase involved in cell wall biosynthesis